MISGFVLLVFGASVTVTLGAPAGTVSTVTVTGAVVTVLPAASVTIVVMSWSPSLSAVGVTEYVPPVHVSVPTDVPSIITSTISPSSVQLPVMVGVLSAVIEASVGAVISAVDGVVSTFTGTTFPVGDVLPVASSCSAVMLWSPSPSGVVGVIL